MSETVAFERTPSVADVATHYCPGCQHGVAHRIVAEYLDGQGLAGNTLMVTSIGCSVLLYNYLLFDAVEAPHGRAPATATGLKRTNPDKVVFTYQGDGDLASIGMAEIMHAANRGERITVVFVNNTVYGMTGGQMAPTTLVGQKTTTCPDGRCASREGQPFHMAEIMAGLPGVAYSARVALNSLKNIVQAKKAVRHAFEAQLEDRGMGFVELLATCPTNWKMTPVQANERVENELIPCFPLGVFKDLKTSGAC
ncbi:thiamine pyrophosphate-dependent enzyme [Fundidesulfovibrio terrae]|uniref:thiamine pyrophosphate-dependent enzyme n=1 Tax=Fundidesulfovibrio terrae TaxID=2922866 RepID=UPI001FAF145E|nr:thiamine pyrophosphate-dependent enzyme [Fundidesulfovibrio terrae]